MQNLSSTNLASAFAKLVNSNPGQGENFSKLEKCHV